MRAEIRLSIRIRAETLSLGRYMSTLVLNIMLHMAAQALALAPFELAGVRDPSQRSNHRLLKGCNRIPQEANNSRQIGFRESGILFATDLGGIPEDRRGRLMTRKNSSKVFLIQFNLRLVLKNRSEMGQPLPAGYVMITQTATPNFAIAWIMFITTRKTMMM